jgi:hypothetical protein
MPENINQDYFIFPTSFSSYGRNFSSKIRIKRMESIAGMFYRALYMLRNAAGLALVGCSIVEIIILIRAEFG